MPPAPSWISRLRRPVLPVLALALLAGCNYTDSAGMPVSMYEGPEGEAVVRALIKDMPDPNPGVPKSYSVVLGDIGDRGDYKAASVPFLKRLSDTGLRFISADVLSASGPDNTIIDPEKRVAMTVLQLRLMRQIDASTWDAEAAWSYKKSFERRRYQVTIAGGKAEAVFVERLEGNWPAKTAAK